jgi:hypothetical protein
MSKKKKKLPFKFVRRSRFEKMEKEVARLKEEAAAFPLYTEYEGEKMQLSQVSYRMLSDLGSPCISNQVHVSSDILGNEDEVDHFTIFLETSLGVFVRMLEEGSDKTLEVDDETFCLKMKWADIWAGKDLTVLDAIIVHRDRPVRRVDSMVGMVVRVGDKLTIDYKLAG